MMLLFAIVLAQAVPAIEPPRGVNDSVIGTVEQFKVAGPARVCMVQGGIDLIAGETAYLSYLGIHAGKLRIVGPANDFSVSEGDIWAAPRTKRHGVKGAELLNVARFGSKDRPRYAVYGRTDFSPDKDRLMIWVDGLRGGAEDVGFLQRIRATVTAKESCQRRFVYGWFFDEDEENSK
jgi:hypothetical protein